MRCVLLCCVALAGLAVGCVDGIGKLKTRAADDFQCKEERLVVRDLGGPQGVEGCGRRATYVCGDSAPASVCDRWVMNTDEQATDSVDSDGFDES